MAGFIVKSHSAKEGVLLAVCDSDILGKRFETDRLQLDLTSNFYQGEEKSEKELDAMIDKAYIVNLVGKRSVGFALKKGLITEDGILEVKGIPHAQVVVVRN